MLRRAPRLYPAGPVAIGLIGLVVAVGALAGCGAGQGVPTAAGSPARPPATVAPEPVRASSQPPPPEVPIRSSSLAALELDPAPAPESLTIAALGIEVPVDPVGVAADGQMEIPPLAERAGWYRFGAAPGQSSGTAVIAAHVDSIASAGLGPFVRLGDAAAGDVVDIALAGGATVQYTVSTVVRVEKPAVSWPEIFAVGGEPRLILITCGGTFQRDEGHYSDNVIVTAVPVGPR